jgi:hypothetical protein
MTRRRALRLSQDTGALPLLHDRQQRLPIVPREGLLDELASISLSFVMRRMKACARA